MGLRACKECSKPVSTTADVCPHCGFKVRQPLGCAAAIGVVLLVAVVISALTSFVEDRQETARREAEAERFAKLTPEKKAAEAKAAADRAAEKRRRDDAVARATAGAQILKRSVSNPDRFTLDSALVVDGTAAVCYEFRAENRFGAIIRGSAVLARDGKRLLVNGMDGFARLWALECNGKNGTQAATAIRWFAL